MEDNEIQLEKKSVMFSTKTVRKMNDLSSVINKCEDNMEVAKYIKLELINVEHELESYNLAWRGSFLLRLLK